MITWRSSNCHHYSLFSLMEEVVHTSPTLGSNVEEVVWKNIHFVMWDLGGQESLRQGWQAYYANTEVSSFTPGKSISLKILILLIFTFKHFSIHLLCMHLYFTIRYFNPTQAYHTSACINFRNFEWIQVINLLNI